MFAKPKTPFLLEILKATFIFLFVYTALSKFFDYRSFTIVLKQSPLIGNAAPLVSVLLPSAEIIVALIMLIPAGFKMGLYTFLSLMIAFTLYILYMLVFSSYLPCSCGGVIKYMSWKQHLLFNISIIALAIVALRLHRQQSHSFLKQKILLRNNRACRKPVNRVGIF
jgi:hypothetical protein